MTNASHFLFSPLTNVSLTAGEAIECGHFFKVVPVSGPSLRHLQTWMEHKSSENRQGWLLAETQEGVFILKPEQDSEKRGSDAFQRERRCLNLVLKDAVHTLAVYRADDFPIPGEGGEVWFSDSWADLPETYEASGGQPFDTHHQVHGLHLMPLLCDEFLSRRPWLQHALQGYEEANDPGKSKVERLSEYLAALNVLYMEKREGITEGLSTRVAMVLARDDDEHSTIMRHLGELYRKPRSKKAHGEVVGLERTIPSSELNELRQEVRRGLLMGMELSKGHQSVSSWERFCSELRMVRSSALQSTLQDVRERWRDIW